MQKRNLFFLSLLILSSFSFLSCRLESSTNSTMCSANLDPSSWQMTTSPNIAVFPQNGYYASVQASTLSSGCDNLFSENHGIRITLNLNANVSGSFGQSLVFAALTAPPRYFVANDSSYNFLSGNLNQTIIDSGSNLYWQPPFANPGFFTLIFEIPSPFYQFNAWPSGSVYVEKN